MAAFVDGAPTGGGVRPPVLELDRLISTSLARALRPELTRFSTREATAPQGSPSHKPDLGSRCRDSPAGFSDSLLTVSEDASRCSSPSCRATPPPVFPAASQTSWSQHKPPLTAPAKLAHQLRSAHSPEAWSRPRGCCWRSPRDGAAHHIQLLTASPGPGEQAHGTSTRPPAPTGKQSHTALLSLHGPRRASLPACFLTWSVRLRAPEAAPRRQQQVSGQPR